MITRVKPGSAADKVGISPGVILHEINARCELSGLQRNSQLSQEGHATININGEEQDLA